MLIGLIIGVLLLILMVLKTKIHAFVALIISAALTGIIGGMEPNSVLNAISKGFGGTLGSIGIIIGFGVIIGEIFEITGAAKRMAKTFIKIFGTGKEELALAVTGFVVSIPIFCDSGFVVLSPLVRAISRVTKKSAVALGVSLALGLVITHSVVPPTPGPVGVAGIFGVSVGSLMIWGLAIAIPMTLARLVYAKYIGNIYYQIPSETDETEYIRLNTEQKKELSLNANINTGLNFINTFSSTYKMNNSDAQITSKEIFESEEFKDENLPSNLATFSPIAIPIFFILLGQLFKFYKIENGLAPLIGFFGSPVIAVAVGVIIAIYALTANHSKDAIITASEKGMKAAGIIILVTGGGGALGMVLRESGVGIQIAEIISRWSIPAILVPFLVATVIRVIQGSGTVAMLTAASITAPMIATLNLNPVFGALAACVGSLFFGYFNDSFFWVVNRTLGIKNAKEQIRIYSIASTIAWATGIIALIILNILFG